MGINHGRKSNGPWYKAQPMGKDKLGSIMARMAQNAGLVGGKTNHSVRRTMCSRLLHAGVPPTMIQQLSGHKNVQSVNNYATASRKQQQTMCNILQGNSPSFQPPQPLSSLRSTENIPSALPPAVPAASIDMAPVSPGRGAGSRCSQLSTGNARTAAVSGGAV